MLVWDQRVLHGTCPNQSARCRLAQYLKAGPRDKTYGERDSSGNLLQEKLESFTHPRLLRRTQALQREFLNSNAISRVSSDIGRYVFALDTLDKIQEEVK